MPRFRDENDFLDRDPEVGGGRSVSSEAVRTLVEEGRYPGFMPVYGPLRGPGQEDDPPGSTADTVPSPKSDDYDEPDFVQVDRADDARRSFVRRSDRWPSTLSGGPARVANARAVPARAFARPWTVTACVERHVRREVLFAKRRAGGAGSRKAKRRTWRSEFRC